MPVVVKDNGYSRRVMLLLAMEPASMSVGIHSAEGGAMHKASEGVTIAEIAEAHELGLGVPRRSFVRSWAEQNRARNFKILNRSLERVAAGKATYAEGLHGAGSVFVADMRLRIARGMITPPLDPYTVEKKGSTTPLLDTGQLASSIRYTFQGKGGTRYGISQSSVKGDSATQASGARGQAAYKRAVRKAEEPMRKAQASEAKAARKANGFIGPRLPDGATSVRKPRKPKRVTGAQVSKAWAKLGTALKKTATKAAKKTTRKVAKTTKRAAKKVVKKVTKVVKGKPKRATKRKRSA